MTAYPRRNYSPERFLIYGVKLLNAVEGWFFEHRFDEVQNIKDAVFLGPCVKYVVLHTQRMHVYKISPRQRWSLREYEHHLQGRNRATKFSIPVWGATRG